MDSVELLFQALLLFDLLYAHSVHVSVIKSRAVCGGTANVEIMLRRDRWCVYLLHERYVRYDGIIEWDSIVPT